MVTSPRNLSYVVRRTFLNLQALKIFHTENLLKKVNYLDIRTPQKYSLIEIGIELELWGMTTSYTPRFHFYSEDQEDDVTVPINGITKSSFL